MTRLVLTAAVATAFALTAMADDAKRNEGFVQLFNGKDLTGWKPHPKDKAVWAVEDGALTGTGAAGELFSDRDDYENFVFRIEAKVNEGGNSGQYFRTKFAPAHPPGYEAQINATHKDPIKTGSLYPAFLKDKTEQAEFRKKYGVLTAAHKPDEWFTQEVTAIGNHIVIKVNDKVTVDYTDPHSTYLKGHFAIQAHDPKSKVWVRKIEVKELPSGN
jgi:hypothetical protein